MKTNRVKWRANSRDGFSWLTCFGYYTDGKLALILTDRIRAGDYVRLRTSIAAMQDIVFDTLLTYDQIDRIYAAHEETKL
jgi:hypothetical protein